MVCGGPHELQQLNDSLGETRDGSWEDANATYERFPQEPGALPVSAKAEMDNTAVEQVPACNVGAGAIQTSARIAASTQS